MYIIMIIIIPNCFLLKDKLMILIFTNIQNKVIVVIMKMILTIIKTVIIKMMLSTNLEDNVLSVPQLHHHVAGLPVHIPRLITIMMLMITKCMGMMTMTTTMMMVMMTMMMMSIADSKVDDPTDRIA